MKNQHKYLIEHEANIYERNNEGEIPLFKATERRNEAIVKILNEFGADVNK